VLVTHWHPDHIGGVRDVQTLDPAPTVHKNSPIRNWSDIKDGERFEVEGATLRAFHSPGHTTDHMSFVLEEEDAIFTGDNVLGHGTAVFEDLPTYIESLTRMADAASGRGYPGHGAVLDSGRARILEYIKHRQQREREVVEVLARSTEGLGLGSMDLVKIIYQDTPENLHFAASRGVVQVLEKLEGEGKVHHNEEENTWSLKTKASL
jgi:ribonuclease/clavin/mitogillin